MADELSKLNFAQDLNEVRQYDDAEKWAIKTVGDLGVWATMSPAGKPTEIFYPQLVWNTYPGDPPSLKFRDSTGRLDQPTAWPELPGFRPGNLDACVNWVAEGFVTHPEWRVDPNLRWDGNGNVLLKVLRRLQDKFDNAFTKRFSS